MNIFLAGAAGVIGRRLVPLLRNAGHTVFGTTRSTDRAEALKIVGATPVMVDVFDAAALQDAVVRAAPDVVIHQLTDLPAAPGTPGYEAGLARNTRLRIEGTANLVAAAKAAGVNRMIAQSIAFAYAKAPGIRVEHDPIDPSSAGVIALERETLSMPQGIVLRYGFFHGPGTWFGDQKRAEPSVHVDAAAQAAVLALTKGAAGVYNIAEDNGVVATDKAKRELGFDAAFRMRG